MLSDAIAIAYCDMPGCNETENFPLPFGSRGYSVRGVPKHMELAGWTVVDENTHYCPSCTEKIEEDKNE